MEPEVVVPLLFGAIFALGLLGAWSSYRREKRRRAALAAAAAGWHLGFEVAPSQGARRAFEHLPLFERGHDKAAANRLFGEMEGFGLEHFDYSYDTGGGKGRGTRNQSVVGVTIPGVHLPAFVLEPEAVLDRLAAVLGAKDFDFATHPEFSRHYALRGDDEDAVRRLFGPGVLAWFERNLGLHVEGAGNVLIVYRWGTVQPVDQVRTALHEALEMARLLAPGAGRAGEVAEA
jgi:hypothetical protein